MMCNRKSQVDESFLRFILNVFIRWPNYVLIFIAIKNVLEVSIKIYYYSFFSEPFSSNKKRFFSGRFSFSVIFEGSHLNANILGARVLRVGGGRLENSNLSFDQSHPILLHNKHKLSTLIILHEHLTHLHAGPQLLLLVIRQQFWIINSRTRINSVIRKCHTCTRLRAAIPIQIVADLPSTHFVPCDRLILYLVIAPF